LRWEKQKLTNVREQEAVLSVLRDGIRSGKYVGEGGCDQFAMDYYQGDSPKAWQVASSLLTAGEFAVLLSPA
jgi:hypothetical protein